ncbi:hypothetical protein [Cellulophaga sp. Hel_I_12]|uniref:hypothetical protein n=1 Tax=Cellulophaga sp. Hel_I_12 TaxID=1249972 RepID=UPI0006474C28|nr:hypothetical protein [Cellulophaga sp. Hel_I_12]
MEIAINSVLLFLFILFPGIIFLRFYFTGEFTKQFSKRPITETIYLSILPGIVIQGITFLTFQKLVNGNKISQYLEALNDLQSNNFVSLVFDLSTVGYFLLYYLFLIVYAILLSTILYKIVRISGLDKYSPVLRFDNTWHYYFSGEVTKFTSYRNIVEKGRIVDLTYADILIRTSEDKTQLYRGILRQHTISKDSGRLEEIYLMDAYRYSDKIDNFKSIPGNIFIIPYENVLNINLTYLTKEYQNKLKNFRSLIIDILLLGILILFLIDVFKLYAGLNIKSQILIRLLVAFAWLNLISLFDRFFPSKVKKAKSSFYTTIALFVLLVLSSIWIIKIIL